MHKQAHDDAKQAVPYSKKLGFILTLYKATSMFACFWQSMLRTVCLKFSWLPKNILPHFPGTQ